MTVVSSYEGPASQPQSPPFDVEEDSDNDSGTIIVHKRQKTILSPSHMCDRIDTVVSQKTLVVLGVPVDKFASTLSDYSNTTSVPFSSDSGDTTPNESLEDPIGSLSPKVSRASHLHFFDLEELRSILFAVTQTLDTPTPLQGTSSALVRTRSRPYLTMG